MKAKHAIVFVIAILLLGGSTLMAGGPLGLFIRVNVPFEFRVGNELMPAGQYRVAHYNARDVLLIQGVDSSAVALVHSIPTGKETRDAAKLIFTRYGEAYFLRQVWIPGTNANELFQSKVEKEYASRWSGPERTTVVATVEK